MLYDVVQDNAGISGGRLDTVPERMVWPMFCAIFFKNYFFFADAESGMIFPTLELMA